MEKDKDLSSQISTTSVTSKAPKRVGNLKQVTTVTTPGQATHARHSLSAHDVSPAPKRSNNVHVAPRKGTYQEILARAKAAQEAQPGSGIIKHKPIEKLSRREKPKQNTKSSYKRHEPKGALSDSVSNTRNTPESLRPGKSAEPSAKKRKRVDLGYKGTMRPSNGMVTQLSSSTFRINATAEGSNWTRACPSRPRASLKYKTNNEPNVEESSEKYSSDASSDMEAAAFDLEEEEQQSLSAAKKEDDAAAAEELEMKRKKAERREKLNQMAKIESKKRKL